MHSAKQTMPCVVYLPIIDLWLNALSTSAWATFKCLLTGITPSTSIIFIATSHKLFDDLDNEVRKLLTNSFAKLLLNLKKLCCIAFCALLCSISEIFQIQSIFNSAEVYSVRPASEDQRRRFFTSLLIEEVFKVPEKQYGWFWLSFCLRKKLF